MWVYVSIELIGSIVRLPLMKHIANIPIIPFIKNVVIRVIGPLAVMATICYISVTHIDMPYRILITFTCSIVAGLLTIFGVALNKQEKLYIKSIIQQLKSR